MKLFRNSEYPNRWYAYSESIGWVMFPAEPDGWSKREPARGIDPVRVRQVALALGSGTGIPETLAGKPAAKVGNLREAA